MPPGRVGLVMLRTTTWRDALSLAIRATPGASTRELARTTGISEWTADYHLRRMLREGALVAETVGRTRCWYAKGCGLCPVLRRAMPMLRRPEALAVALASPDDPEPLPRLASRAGVSVGTARWVTTVLADAFLLERNRFGRVALRPGAGTCLSAASAGRRCDLWGKCAVSRAWLAAGDASLPRSALEDGSTSSRGPSAREAAPGRSSGPPHAPSSG